MDKMKNEKLEDIEAIAILVGTMIGVGMLALPAAVAKEVKQDGWISVIVGGIHPLFFALMAMYYMKYHPNENILILSKKYLGKLLGSILNLLFMVQFMLYALSGSTGLNNIFRVYATNFLTPIKILIPTMFAIMYLSIKGIPTIKRINKIALYFSIILTFLLLTALRYGNYLNIFPIGGECYRKILKSSVESAYSYGGMEVIFLIYPILKNKNKIKSITLKAVFITTCIYTWVTFITIYYLGYIVTTKALWPVLLVTEGVNSPIINSFRLLFLFLWSFVMLKVISNEYYMSSYILSDTFKIKNINKICYFAYPIMIYICLNFTNEVFRREVMGKIIPKATVFNIIYVSIISILIFIKNNK